MKALIPFIFQLAIVISFLGNFPSLSMDFSIVVAGCGGGVITVLLFFFGFSS